MKVLIIISIAIVVVCVLYSCISTNNEAKQTARPPKDKKPDKLIANDRLILVDGVAHADIKKALVALCNMYNQQQYTTLPRLYQLSNDKYAITFPYDIDFVGFCYSVNYLNYPIDIKWNGKVRAWTTTKSGEEWITDKSANKQVMLYLSKFDKEYDNVFLTTADNIGYKLGFAAGQETQLLPMPEERYKAPTLTIDSLSEMAFEDFQ